MIMLEERGLKSHFPHFLFDVELNRTDSHMDRLMKEQTDGHRQSLILLYTCRNLRMQLLIIVRYLLLRIKTFKSLEGQIQC